MVSHADVKTCIRLLGQEAFPAMREMAKEFELKSALETNQPVSVAYMKVSDGPSARRRSSRPQPSRPSGLATRRSLFVHPLVRRLRTMPIVGWRPLGPRVFPALVAGCPLR